MRLRAFRAPATLLALGLALLIGGACTDGAPSGPADAGPDDTPSVPTPTSISISPVPGAVIVGTTLELRATITDSEGGELDEEPAWTTLDPDLLRVGPDGSVEVVKAGSARVVATAGTVSDTVALECVPRLEVSRDSAMVRPGAQLQLAATLVGADVPEPPPGAVSWSSRDEAVAEVTVGGLVSGMAMGRTTVQAAYGEQVVDVDIHVYRPQFASVSAGMMHSCGLLVEGKSMCWGANGHGDLGTGDTDHRSVPTPTATDLFFTQLEAAGGFTCAVAMDRMGYCWGDDSMMELGNPEVGRISTVPSPVYGGMSFQMMSGSDMAHGCGLTLAGDAWCWGYNRFGMIGHGVARDEPVPVPTMGGHKFTALHSFFFRTCGVDTDGHAHCWGRGGAAQVGDPSFEPETCSGQPCSTRPHAVESDTRFTAISVGRLHTCGIGDDERVYCWGEGAAGQLGTGAYDEVFVPTTVLPDERFMAVTTGRDHSCALTVDGRALCWGENEDGQLGDGSRTTRPSPADVSTHIRFVGISAGYMHTCAVTAEGEAYCWGANGMGQLGDGSMVDRLVPARVHLDEASRQP